MKKLFLFAASLGLATFPVTTLVACGGGHKNKEFEKDERDENDQVKVASSYKTSLNEIDTSDFEMGRRYSASKLGLDTTFNQNFEFEVKDYDDLKGVLTVSVEQRKNQEFKVIRDNVTIRGFKTLSAEQSLEKIIGNLPSDGIISSELTSTRPSELAKNRNLNAEFLGIAQHFNFRKAKHSIKVTEHKHDDLVGELEINLTVTLANRHERIDLVVTDLKAQDLVLKERFKKVRQVIDKLDRKATTRNKDKLPSEVKQRVGDEDFWDQLGIGAFPDYDAGVIQRTFEFGQNTSDAKGILEVVVSLKVVREGNSAQKSKTILISGFLHSKDTKHDKDKIKIQTVKNYFENNFNKKTTLQNELPSEVKKKFDSSSNKTLALLGLAKIPENLLDGVEISFKLEQISDENGTLVLVVKISAGNAAPAEIRLTIEGFQTTADRDKEREEKQRKINEGKIKSVIKYLEGDFNKKTTLQNELPSEVKKKFDSSANKTLALLGLAKISENLLDGVEISFELGDSNDENGTLVLVVNISAGNADPAEIRLTIEGFETKEIREEKQRKINEGKIESVAEYLKKVFVKKTTLQNELPSEVKKKFDSSANKTLALLGLAKISENLLDGVEISFELGDANDENGTLVLVVNISAGNADPAEIRLTIEGFETKEIREEKQRKINEGKIESVAEYLKKVFVKKTTLQNELPSEVKKKFDSSANKTLALLGLAKISENLLDGVEISFELGDANDENGTLVLVVKISAGNADPAEIRLTIEGFQVKDSRDKWDRDKIDNIITRLEKLDKKTLFEQILPSESSKSFSDGLRWRRESFPKNPGYELGYFFGVIVPNHIFAPAGVRLREGRRSDTIWFDDNAGTLTLVMKIALGSVEREYHFTIKGYLTTKGREEINSRLKDYLTYIEENRVRTSFNNKLPSQIASLGDKLSFKELGLLDVPTSIMLDFILETTVTNVDDENGRLEIGILLSKKRETPTGWVHPSSPSRKYALIEKKETLVGKIVVSGYSTRELYKKQRKINETKIESVIKYLKGDFNKETTLQNELPSEVKKKFDSSANKTLALLGLAKISENLLDGVEISFELGDANDENGTLVLVVKISAGNADPAEIRLTIEDFQTKDGRDKWERNKEREEKQRKINEGKIESVIKYLESDFNKKTTLQNELPSEVKKKFDSSANKTLALLGLAKISENLLDGVEISFELGDANDENGTLVLVVKISAGNAAPAEIRLTIEDFEVNEKTKRKDEAKINTIFKRLWDIGIMSLKNYHSWLLPSEYWERVTKTIAQKIKEMLKKETERVQIKFYPDEDPANDDKGVLVIVFEIRVGNLRKKFTYNKPGFLSKKELQAWIETYHNEIQSKNNRTSFKNKLPSQIGSVNDEVSFEELGLNEKLPSEFTIRRINSEILSTWSKARIIITKIDNEKGQIEIKFQFTKGLATFLSKKIVVSGYKNKEQETRERKDNELKIGRVLQHLREYFETGTTLKDHLPSEVKRKFESSSNKTLALLGLAELPESLLDGVEISFELGDANDENGTLVLVVKISAGNAAPAEIRLTIEGFLNKTELYNYRKSLLINLLNYIDKNRDRTSLDNKLPSQIGSVKEEVSFEKLGLQTLPNSILSDASVRLVIEKVDDLYGVIIVRVTVWQNSSDLMSETLLVTGYWSNAKRNNIREKVEKEFAKLFTDFAYEKHIGDLTEEQVLALRTWDFTAHGAIFIGDDNRYSEGQELSIEELKLLKKTELLKELVSSLGAHGKFVFQIVERPESDSFHGSILVRAVVRYLDLEVASQQIVVIGGFKSFESYFWDQVAIWKEKLSSTIHTNSQGSYLSLINGLNMRNIISNVSSDWETAKRFMEATGLAQTFAGMSFGNKYQLEVKAVLASIAKDPGTNYQLYEKAFHDHCVFEFVVGLKGDQWSQFNQKIYDRPTNELESFFQNYEKNYRGKRSFSKTLTGFDSSAEIAHKIRKGMENPVVTGGIDSMHFRGILRHIYGGDSLPEFPYDFNSSNTYQDKKLRLESFLPLGDYDTSKKLFQFPMNYNSSSRLTVQDWLNAIGKNKWLSWKNMPINWDVTFDASIRPWADQAEPFFIFREVVFEGDQRFLQFDLVLLFRDISPFKGKLFDLWSQNQHSSHDEYEISELKSQVFNFRMFVPDSLTDFMEKAVQIDSLKNRFFTEKMEQDLGVKLLSSTDDHYKIEVKLPVFKSSDKVSMPAWETNLRAKQHLFDNQADFSPGSFVWKANPWWVLGDLVYGKGFLVSQRTKDIFVSKRYTLFPREFEQYEINFEKYLGEVGITIMWEKISSSGFDHLVDYDSEQYNGVIKFRPWLTHNLVSATWLDQNQPKFHNPANLDYLGSFVISDAIWEIHYKLVKN